MVQQRAVTQELPAYVQGRSIPNAIKLSANENPYPPLASVVQTVSEQLGGMNYYPDMSSAALMARIADRHSVRVEEVAVGAGSVEVAQQLINASAGEGDEVMFAWRSFEAYPILVKIAGATPVMVPLTADERHDLPAMAAAVTDRTRLILLCTPNNPTGHSLQVDELEEFLAAVPKNILVVIDEAYTHFDTDPNSVNGLDFFRKHENVAVLHTFSKAYGLAGLRVGYAIAPEPVAENLRRVAVPFGVTSLAQTAAIASLDAEDELNERVTLITAERDRVITELRNLGWPIAKSQGNFIWIRAAERTAEINDALLAEGIVARAFMGDGVRITIGTPEMSDLLVRTLAEIEPIAS